MIERKWMSKARIVLAVLCVIAVGIWIAALYHENDRLSAQIAVISDENAALQAQAIEYRSDAWDAQQRIIELENLPPQVEKVIVKEPFEVIKEIEVPTHKLLNGFNNLEELKSFLASDNTDTKTFRWEGSTDGTGTCALYAFALRLNAEKAGYYLSWQILEPEEMERIEGINGWHIMNMAEVNGEFYLIEPQTDNVYSYAYWR